MEPFAPDAELAAIRECMMQPISREQQAAAELWGYLTTVGPATGQDFAAWTHDDWLRIAAHMIMIQDRGTCPRSFGGGRGHGDEQSAREPLPTFDELGD
jgi:hypothetical protein